MAARSRYCIPGFRSVEGGPDFRGAVIQFGDGPPKTGDVEVDIRASGWRAHGHDRNPAFKNVILHVIWDGERELGERPLLPLREVIDAPLGELSLWLGSEASQTLPENLRGKCSAPLRELDETACENWCIKRHKCGFKTKPHNSRRAQNRPDGSKRSGRDYFGAWLQA